MRTRILIFFSLIFLFLISQAVVNATLKNTVVFKNVTVIPMNAELSLTDQDLFVVDGKVLDIVATGEREYPRDALIIEGNGRYLTPGLIDAHVHLLEERGLQLFLMNGVTTVRVMEGKPEHLQWRKSVESGVVAGPHLVLASPILHREESERFHYVSTPEQARSEVRAFQNAGYDWIKILRLDKSVLIALMDEAIELGMPVGGHNPNFELDSFYGEEIQGSHEEAIPFHEVLASGMASLEHLSEIAIAGMNGKLDPRQISALVMRIKESGIVVTPMIHAGILWNEMLSKEEKFLDSARREKIHKYLGDEKLSRAEKFLTETLKTYDEQTRRLQTNDVPFLLRLLKDMSDAGVFLVAGSDTGGFSSVGGFSLQDELEVYVQAGLTPYLALRSATHDGAKLLNRLSSLGTIETGKDADLVLLRNNPLQDIRAIRNVEGVMISGKWFSSEELKSMDDSFSH